MRFLRRVEEFEKLCLVSVDRANGGKTCVLWPKCNECLLFCRCCASGLVSRVNPIGGAPQGWPLVARAL